MKTYLDRVVSPALMIQVLLGADYLTRSLFDWVDFGIANRN